MSRFVSRLASLVRRIALRSYYWVLNRLSGRSLAYDPKGPIVSLTTYHKRLADVYLTIESIFRQSKGVSGVYLWLTAEDARRLPRSIQRLIPRGLSVAVVNENVKSYKKLVYCLQIPDWTHVITADDDVFYPSNWVETLYAPDGHSENRVRCLRAQVIEFNADGSARPYSGFRLATSAHRDCKLLPTGVSGILYPREALTADLTNTELSMQLCPSADDVWFRYCTWFNGFEVELACNESLNFPPTTFPWADGLFKTNISSANDVAITNAQRYFSLRGPTAVAK